ncbi:MAG: metallophosphoesterase [Rubrivivax sp.]|nr:metallophosphoesterase [Rubrivivax sp.]
MATNAIDGLPTYGAVYVVSDLHLGGFEEERGRNYRIFRAREARALEWLIDQGLAKESVSGRRCLVLNGDIVDFLAHRTPRYFDWAHAVDKLNDAIGDKEQAIVWQALRRFVTEDIGDLVIVLGNHDVELALPEPQQVLLHYLTQGRLDLRGRIHFALDGAGFACRVAGPGGGKRVLCLHGNEADPWNAIDYGRLSLIRRALARGSMDRNALVLDNWIPNAGTQLVIEYLNGQKRKYQWIDLLKPEEEAVGMITAALCNLPAVRTFAETMAQQSRTRKQLADGFMAGTHVQPSTAADAAAAVAVADPPLPVPTAVARAIDALGSGQTPEDLVREPDDAYLMGKIELAARTLQLKAWPSSLREVLASTLADDRSFEFSETDATFRELDNLVGPDPDFLVAGHTHLHRACERKRFPGKYYFNSGTWIQILSIPKELLAPDLYPFLKERLEDGSIDRLEQAIHTPRGEFSLLRTRRTVVCIAPGAGGTVRGELRTVEEAAVPAKGTAAAGRKAGATPAGWKLVPVGGSTFPSEGGAE